MSGLRRLAYRRGHGRGSSIQFNSEVMPTPSALSCTNIGSARRVSVSQISGTYLFHSVRASANFIRRNRGHVVTDVARHRFLGAHSPVRRGKRFLWRVPEDGCIRGGIHRQ